MHAACDFISRKGAPLCLALVAVLGSPARPAEVPDAERAVVEAAIAAVKPALVRIHLAEVDYSEGREIKIEAIGSGVIITKEGHVVTNHHVAGRAKRIVCTLANKEQVEADLVGTDVLMDTAVIKLRPAAGREFPVAKWGDSSELAVGDRVLAMGSPLALSQSVTMGIVSNIEMIIPELWGGSLTLEGEDVGSMVRWIGHDAAIEPGNSGGPLVNLKGEIVGINEINLGLGGAIPSNLVRQVAEQIITSGKVKRTWIGIGVQPVLKGASVQRGVLVGGVIPGSPAATAGFKPGDVLVRLAGKEVSVRFAEELPLFNQMVASLPVGQEVEAVVLRDGKEVTLRVGTRERPEAQPRPREFKQWGMCASNISFIVAREMKRPNEDGVLVKSVRPGGPCGEAKPDIDGDDVIVEVDGKPVKNIEELAQLTATIAKDKTEPTPVLVAFDRKSERLVTVVKVGTKNLEDPGREVRKAYLAVGMQVLTHDMAEALGAGERTGVRVTQVYPNSSAQKAGLKVGDLIVSLDGEEISASQPEDTEVLPAMIRQYKIGATANLTVIREKQQMKIPVVLQESLPLPREMKKYRDDNFEFTVRDLAFQDRIQQNLEKDLTGVYVEEVSEGGWAALGRLSAGDIVCAVDREMVGEVGEMKAIMQKVGEQKPKHVVLRVRRGIQEVFVELETDWSSAK